MTRSTGGGANDEEARSAESSADVAHKVSVAAKELGESVSWLKLIHRAHRSSREALTPWIEEGQQLVRILAASARTAKGRSLSESAAAPQSRQEKQTTCLGGRVSGRTSSLMGFQLPDVRLRVYHGYKTMSSDAPVPPKPKRRTRRTENIAIVKMALSRRKGGATRLVEKYKGLVLSNIKRIVPDQDTAQDLLQETFMTAFKNLRQLRRAENLKSWLVQIGKRIALTYRRSKGKQMMDNAISLDEIGPSGSERIDEIASDEDFLEQRLLEADLDRALGLIPDAYKEALILRFKRKLQFHEIATELGIGVPLAKFRVRYGLQKLKSALLHEED